MKSKFYRDRDSPEAKLGEVGKGRVVCARAWGQYECSRRKATKNISANIVTSPDIHLNIQEA